MKKRNTIKATAILCIMALCINTSCTNDEATNDATLRPIELKAVGLTAIGNTRSTVDGDWYGTSGKSVAIQIGSEVKEYTITPSNDNTTATIAVATGVTPFYWDTETKTVTAWYPYSDEYPTSWEVKTDQSNKEDYLACDLLKAESKEITYGKTNTIEFAHQVARITITITDGITGDKQDATSLTILGSYTPYHTSTGTYDLLLAPQDIASGTQLFIIETADGAFAYSTPSAITLTANQHLTYNVKTTLDGLEVTSVSNTDGWSDGGSSTENPNDRSYTEVNLSNISDGQSISGNVRLTGYSDYDYSNYDYNKHLILTDGTRLTLRYVTLMSTSDSNEPLIKCQGNVTIILEGEYNAIYSYNSDNCPAIKIEYGTLTIEGSGELYASGGKNAAGIDLGNDGNIEIKGGTIIADGGKYGAGIGSGYYGHCGNITIRGGEVTAWGGCLAAGIGSGYEGYCGDIIISGGTVTAYGGSPDTDSSDDPWGMMMDSGGAGIGAGYQGHCQNITIRKGVKEVYAKSGGISSPAIGASSWHSSQDGSTTIEDGANVIQN